MKTRIWELDALRGLCIIGMVIVHFVYDVVNLYALADWKLPELFLFVQQWGGVLFLLISGVCVTLGSRSVRRGILVFCCGLVVSGVTAGMYFLNLANVGIIIYFGVLHCLGVCMMLWPMFKKLPVWLLLVLGCGMVALGFWFQGLPPVEFPWLVPLGIMPRYFISSDYFPLMPHLGFFLLGAVIGRTLYRNQQTVLPGVSAKNPIVRFLTLCGKHSLWIYLLHQPALSLIFYLITLLC